jgi:hypothetical protein
VYCSGYSMFADYMAMVGRVSHGVGSSSSQLLCMFGDWEGQGAATATAYLQRGCLVVVWLSCGGGYQQ